MKYHSKKLRLGRVSLNNQVYLITGCTHQRQKFFLDFKSAARLSKELFIDTDHYRCLAYVVMPDHFHWLIHTSNTNFKISNSVRLVKAKTTMTLKQRFRETKKFWQDGFHDSAIRDQDMIYDAARYIVANPLRAKLIDTIKNYPFWNAIWF